MDTDVMKRAAGSFRDPCGTVYKQGGSIFRSVSLTYKDKYDRLMSCGLYDELIAKKMLVAHRECDDILLPPGCCKMLAPEVIPFISYPYEWSFGELRDAALLTLNIHMAALETGMILKDASAYNVQFINGAPIFIDTLSFDIYTEGAPWIAYGQFCRHFLAPLLLMAYTDISMNKLLVTYIDGIPIPLADKLLHGKGGMFAKQHISWQAKAIARHDADGAGGKAANIKEVKITLFQMKAMIGSLIRGIEAIKPEDTVTEWGDYYSRTNYTAAAESSKETIVSQYINDIAPRTVWDIGANDGRYSAKALSVGAAVVAFDIDPVAVERNYMRVKKEHTAMLPLLYDFTNPFPAIGFANRERLTIEQRQRPDMIMLLAVLHHMVISNNLPFSMIAEYFASLTANIIIEFVPKEDSQVKILLATRDDIFTDYAAENFEKSFSAYFEIVDRKNVEGSGRIIYRMRSKVFCDEEK